MRKYLLIILTSLISIIPLKADNKSYTYQTYSLRDFSGWPAMLDSMTNALKTDSSKEAYINTLRDYYGYVGHLLDIGDKSQADVWCKKGNSVLKEAKKKYPGNASITALESMFIAFQIAISPLKAPFQASSMMSSAKEGLRLDSSLNLTNNAEANILFYFPEALGGDKQKAITYYQKAYQYFLDHPDIANENWMYLNIMSTLAVANESVGNLQQALNWCKKALQIQPDFVYVRQILLPRIEKKLTNSK